MVGWCGRPSPISFLSFFQPKVAATGTVRHGEAKVQTQIGIERQRMEERNLRNEKYMNGLRAGDVANVKNAMDYITPFLTKKKLE